MTTVSDPRRPDRLVGRTGMRETAAMVDLAPASETVIGPRGAQPRNWLLFHGCFAIVAALGLLVPVGSLGIRVLVLVIGYSVGIVTLARVTHDHFLWLSWATIAPLSLLLIFPDWFLSAVLGTIEFPDTGSPYVGTMPIFMAFMWTVALLPVMLLGSYVDFRRGLAAGLLVAVVTGLGLFVAAEYAAPLVPFWYPVNVITVGGVALYVLLPEAALTAATYLLMRGAADRPRWATGFGIVAIPFMYLGMLATAYQFIG